MNMNLSIAGPEEIYKELTRNFSLKQLDKIYQSFHYLPNFLGSFHENSKFDFIVLLKNGNIPIGCAHIQEFGEKMKYASMTFIEIIPNERGKGYSDILIKESISLCEKFNLPFMPSSYTEMGRLRIRRNIESACEEKNVKLMPNQNQLDAKSFRQNAIRVLSNLQDANDHLRKGFFFEEGGCWAMALVLREFFTRKSLDSKIAYDSVANHCFTIHDDICYDYTGEMVEQPKRRNELSYRELIELTKIHKCFDDLESDMISAWENIETAQDMANESKYGLNRP